MYQKSFNAKIGCLLRYSDRDERDLQKNASFFLTLTFDNADEVKPWFWSKEWQEKEKEADMDKRAGRIHRAKDVDDLIRQLEQD